MFANADAYMPFMGRWSRVRHSFHSNYAALEDNFPASTTKKTQMKFFMGYALRARKQPSYASE